MLRAAAAALVAIPAAAMAALGGDASSVLADSAALKGALATSSAARYTVQEIRVESGTVVRQYVSPAGRVFAVTWNGPMLPDLRQVLGAYFERYVDAASQRRARGPVLIQQPDLVVQSGGHMRAFAGSAYLPGAVPQGVSSEEIR